MDGMSGPVPCEVGCSSRKSERDELGVEQRGIQEGRNFLISSTDWSSPMRSKRLSADHRPQRSRHTQQPARKQENLLNSEAPELLQEMR